MATAPLRVVNNSRNGALARRLTNQSSLREKVLEHLLLGQLGMEFLARGMDYEVLHAEADRHGHDVLLEAGEIMRHVQLKVTILNGARADVTVSTRLAAKPSGCVVWLTFDPDRRDFTTIRWFGNRPGERLPDLGEKVARHSRGDKAFRPDHRIVPVRRFERLDDIAHLADRLFGAGPADPFDLLLIRLRQPAPSGHAWLTAAANGNFSAIPTDVDWETGGAELGSLLDGHRMLETISEHAPDHFLDQQRAVWNGTGAWNGDAITLWTTLFLEVRADRFGANDESREVPHLDQLCRQLRAALIELEMADA